MSDDSASSDGSATDGSGLSLKTVTGGIAAVGTLLAAIAALINSTTALRSKPAAVATAAALAETGVAAQGSPHRPPPSGEIDREFRVGIMSDGFAAVRKDRSVNSEELDRLPSGAHVVCGNLVADLNPASPRKWRYCAAHRGYVGARLLVPLQPG